MPCTVTVRPNGPYLVPGPVRYVDEQGQERVREGKMVALCRCGASADKPFCDGSHKRAGFTAAGGEVHSIAAPA